MSQGEITFEQVSLERHIVRRGGVIVGIICYRNIGGEKHQFEVVTEKEHLPGKHSFKTRFFANLNDAQLFCMGGAK